MSDSFNPNLNGRQLKATERPEILTTKNSLALAELQKIEAAVAIALQKNSDKEEFADIKESIKDLSIQEIALCLIFTDDKHLNFREALPKNIEELPTNYQDVADKFESFIEV